MVTKRKKGNQKNGEDRITPNRTIEDEFLEFFLNLTIFDNISITDQKLDEKERTLSENKFLHFLSDFEKSIFYRIEENENIGILSPNRSSIDKHQDTSWNHRKMTTNITALEKTAKEEKVNQLITKRFNDQFKERIRNSIIQDITKSGENPLEQEVYSKIYWADLGTYFMNLLYSEQGFKIPKPIERLENRGRITNAKDGNKNFEIDYNKVNFITGIEANRITSYYNADALTVGNNIFISQNRQNLRSPQGIGLLVHELVHVKQMKERGAGYDTGYGINNSLPTMVKSSEFENEAIEQEERIISYMYSQRLRGLEDTININKPSIEPNNTEIPFFANPFDTYDNTFSHSYVDIFTNISRNVYVSDNIATNVDNNNDPIIHNEGLIDDNFIDSSVSALLSNSHLFRGLDHVNSEYLSFLGQNTINDNSDSPSYPPTPILFASRDRTVNPTSNAPNTNSSLSSTAMANSSKIQPSISSGANPTNTFPSVDIEYLAERVYNIIQNKIQIQKMRRGIS